MDLKLNEDISSHNTELSRTVKNCNRNDLSIILKQRSSLLRRVCEFSEQNNFLEPMDGVCPCKLTCYCRYIHPRPLHDPALLLSTMDNNSDPVDIIRTLLDHELIHEPMAVDNSVKHVDYLLPIVLSKGYTESVKFLVGQPGWLDKQDFNMILYYLSLCVNEENAEKGFNNFKALYEIIIDYEPNYREELTRTLVLETAPHNRCNIFSFLLEKIDDQSPPYLSSLLDQFDTHTDIKKLINEKLKFITHISQNK